MIKVGVRALGLAVTLSLGAMVTACGDYAPTQPTRLATSTSTSVGPGSSKSLTPHFLDTPNDAQSVANAINIAGIAVGSYDSAGSGVERPALWTRRGGFRDLGTLEGATQTAAQAINNAGEIIGVASVPGSGFHGVLWFRAGSPIDLGTSFIPADVNDRGQIAGTLVTNHHPAILDHDTIQDIGLPDGALSGTAVAINLKGEVIATVSAANVDHRVAVWRPRIGWTVYSPGSDNEAADINDIDDLLGTNDDVPFRPRATLWPRAGSPIDLGSLGGPNGSSIAGAVNDFTVVVGRSTLSNGTFSAFRWTESTGMTALPTIDDLASAANDINDLGETVGQIGGRAAIWTWLPTPGLVASTRTNALGSSGAAPSANR